MTKTFIAAAKFGWIAAIFMSAGSSADAHSTFAYRVASYGESPSDLYVARAYTFPGSIYQNPDGSYESATEFSRDLEGTPCGIECTREALVRLNKYNAKHSGTRPDTRRPGESGANSFQPQGSSPSSY